MRGTGDLRPAGAGIAYFASIFAVGFVLGAIRTAFLHTDADDTIRLLAVMVEIPVMLAVAWAVCGWLVRHFDIPPHAAARIVMGTVALGFLLAAEFVLGMVLTGQSVSHYLLTYLKPSFALGLAAQFCFAAFPLVRLVTEPLRSPAP